MLYCSNTTFSLVESLPLLTNKLNVPDEVSWEEISILKLSLLPLSNTPFASNEPVLFCISPIATVANVKAVALALVMGEVAEVNDPLTTRVTNKVSPPWLK